MGKFFSELKRRHIYRVAAAYAVVAWLLIQLVNNIVPMLKLPDWIGPAIIVLLAIGFPIALIFAWVLQLASTDGAAASTATGKLDWLFIGALVAVLAVVSYQQLSPTREAGLAPNEQASVTAARSAAASPATAISVVVMPFANLSGDPNQGYFSDGMTDEISGALAKIPDLRVVARSSAFQFKGKNEDARTVGKALNATHLIEGSVRKAGDQLRISAELVRANDGVTIWSNSYDRELKDVFAIQEDIARSIATSLNMQLGLAPGENLVSDRAIDPESYQQYLRARDQLRIRSADQAVSTLEAVVAHDPNYAPAWALLPEAYTLEAAYNAVSLRKGTIEDQRRAFEAVTDKIEKAAREAIRLDRKLPGGYVGLAVVEGQRRNLVMADQFSGKALALDPSDPETLDYVSQQLFFSGYLKESLQLRKQLRLLEPFVPIYELTTAQYMRVIGQTEAAIQLITRAPADGQLGERRAIALAMAYADLGQYDKAADALLAMPADQNRTSKADATVAAQLLRKGPGKVSGNLPALRGGLTFVYGHVGAPDRILDEYEAQVEGRLPLFAGLEFWDRTHAPVRRTERFKALVRKAGWVDLWRAKGWPDLCHPTTADDFVCE